MSFVSIAVVYDRLLLFLTMNLLHTFANSLEAKKNEVGLEFGPATFTFGEIDARSNQMAQLLKGRGFESGDRLCVYLENCVEFIDLFLACSKLGVIFVPINILYREREVTHIYNDANPKALIDTVDDKIIVREHGSLGSAGGTRSVHNRRRAVSCSFNFNRFR